MKGRFHCAPIEFEEEFRGYTQVRVARGGRRDACSLLARNARHFEIRGNINFFKTQEIVIVEVEASARLRRAHFRVHIKQRRFVRMKRDGQLLARPAHRQQVYLACDRDRLGRVYESPLLFRLFASGVSWMTRQQAEQEQRRVHTHIQLVRGVGRVVESIHVTCSEVPSWGVTIVHGRRRSQRTAQEDR